MWKFCRCIYLSRSLILRQSRGFADGPTVESVEDNSLKKTPSLFADRLKSRSMLCVTGPESMEFLDSLMTNTAAQLESGASSIFSYFLNAQGRVLHDAILYKPSDDPEYLVECDIASIQALQVHMTMYRGRRKVEIRSVEHEVSIWSVCDSKEVDANDAAPLAGLNNHDTSFLDDLDLGDNVLVARDPRMWPLGVRVIAPKDFNITKAIVAKCKINVGTSKNAAEYQMVRYKLGIGEGSAEIGYGRSFPEELNGDYTGALYPSKMSSGNAVVNRLMPIYLSAISPKSVVECPITDVYGRKKTPIGILRGVQGCIGLGLMNIAAAIQDKRCKVNGTPAQCIRPPWWRHKYETKIKQSA